MAIVRAVKTGNWSDTTVWNTGALPTSADDVYSNTFTVTIDVSPTVLSISNAAATGVTTGGGFTVNANGITLTCAAASGIIHNGAANCVTVSSLLLGASCTINANVVAGSGFSTHAVVNNSAGALVINGNVTGSPLVSGGGGAIYGVNNASTGTTSINGNVTGGTAGGGTTAYGANNASSGILNVTGNVMAGSSNTSGGTTNNAGVNNNAGGIVNITGTITGGSGTACVGATNLSSGTMNITGSIVGGAGSISSPGAINNSSGTFNHVGSVLASATSPGVGSGATLSQITILTGPLISTDGSGGTAAASGVNPCIALRWFPADTALGTFEYRMRGQTVSGSPSVRPARQLFLTDAYAATYPNASNVRSATTYGPGSIYTGTCAVPPAGSVAFGVPVDNTTGTAAIDGASIRAAVGLASANLDSQLSDKPSATAIRTELDSNSTKLANLDATISSRSTYAGGDTSGTTTLLGRLTGTRAGYLDNLATAPPTAADIAAAVWAAGARTLTAAIDQSSTIAAAVWSAATRTITGGTVDSLTNAPDVPTEAEIATAVRTELSTELGRIDAAVSSRLAPDGTLARVTLTDTATTLTNAPTVPTPSQIASQVRTELATELARLDAAVSTRLATSGYTAPDAAATIATAVNTALDRTGFSLTEPEREAIATAVQAGILDDDDGQAILNAIVTAIGNSNVDEVALVAAIRADLEREGGAIDTRLAAADYTEPPTAEANAAAVRTELSTELERVSNCATVETTGEQIATLI